MNPYTIIGLLVAWALSLAGVGAWQNTAGHVAERTTWQTRENDQLHTANALIKTLEEGARRTEQAHAEALASISTDYQGRLSNATKQIAADRAAVRNGTLRLRDPGTSGICANTSNVPGLAASTSGRDDGTDGRLSDQTAEFLLTEADRADSIVDQLTACQQVVRADRIVNF